MSHPMVRFTKEIALSFHSAQQFIAFQTCTCELCHQESFKGNRELPTKEFVIRFFQLLVLHTQARTSALSGSGSKVIRGQSQKRMARWPKTNNGDEELYWKSTAFDVVCVF